MKVPGYCKPRPLDKPEVAGVLSGNIIIQEKIDGSQGSFMVEDGELLFRSKGQMKDCPEDATPETSSGFEKTISSLKQIAHILRDDLIYRGEVMSKTRQNRIIYGRTPIRYIIIYDIQRKVDHSYLSTSNCKAECDRVGLEYVQVLFEGSPTPDVWKELRDNLLTNTVPMLGGGIINPDKDSDHGLIEGYVIKNYEKINIPQQEVMMGKVVANEFREVQKHKTVADPAEMLLVAAVVDKYRTEARYYKCLQHLRDEDKLTGQLRDIPVLCKEIIADIDEEQNEDLVMLPKALKRKFNKALSYGIMCFYKQYVKEQQGEVDLFKEK